MNKKCSGCGVELQTKDKEKPGYIREDMYEKASYCERCFKINNYNEKTITNLENVNNYIIEEINKKAKYVYFMVDLLNINKETIKTYNAIKAPKTLIISKLDIIPRSIKCQNITNWLREVYGINDKVIYQSSKKEIHTGELLSNLEKSNQKEAYLVGYTNSGKSTLINSLIGDKKLTTSNNINTTMDFIRIKLDNRIIIDSPGFTYNNTLYKTDDFDLIMRLNPRKFLKPRTYQTKEITNLIIENKISIKTSNKNSLTFYVSDDIGINRVFDNEEEKLLKLPENKLKIEDNSDLVIKSLGFINIKKTCELTINIENKDLIEIRPSMFR